MYRDVEVPFPLPLVLLSHPLHSDSSLGQGEGLSIDTPSLDWTSDRGVRNDIATAIATPYNQASSSSSPTPSSPTSSCTEAPVHAEHSVNISPSQDTYLAHLDAAVTMTSSTSERDCVASRIDRHSHTDMEIDMDYTEREGEMKREMEEGQGDIAISIAIAEQWTACVHCTTDNPPNAARCEVCFGALSDAGRGL